jgi:hypothetical protein
MKPNGRNVMTKFYALAALAFSDPRLCFRESNLGGSNTRPSCVPQKSAKEHQHEENCRAANAR